MSIQSSLRCNVQPATPTSTITSTHSKARLLFNSDGSVKLLGDPSAFGIDTTSHILVPTVGLDGKMTMLLAPTTSQGKTFILNPTNGGTLPCPTTMFPSSTASTPLTTGKPIVQKNSPVVLTPAEMETLPKTANQTSLLQTTKYVTHMRIDPSGSCISKVRMPIIDTKTTNALHTPIHSNNALPSGRERMVGSALKALAEHVKSKSLVDNSGHSMLGLRTSDVNDHTVKLNHSFAQVRSVMANKSQWTTLDSIIPSSVDNFETSLGSECPTGYTVVRRNSDLSKRYVILPSVSGASGTNQKPAKDASSFLTGLDMFHSKIQPTGTGTAPAMTFGHDYSSGLKLLRNASKALPTHADPSITTSGVSMSSSLALSRQVHPGDTQSSFGIQTQMKSSGSDESVAHSGSLNSSANGSDCSTESAWEVDPLTGPPATQESEANPEEDGIMSIKIDSVFSLAMDRDNENSSTRKRKYSDLYDSMPILPIEVKTEEEADVSAAILPCEPKQVTCPPCYVVLEQLSRSQIEDTTQNMFKCSNYCRLRTLNFLCSLGLVECEPIVHTIRPDACLQAEQKADSEKDESQSDVTDSRTALSQNVSDSKVTDTDRCSPENPVSEHSAPSLHKVRKVETGSQADTGKVIRFIKVESTRQSLPISVKSLIPQSTKTALKSLLATTQANRVTVPGGSTVKICQPFTSVTNAFGLTRRTESQTFTSSSTVLGSTALANQYLPYASSTTGTSCFADNTRFSSCQNTVLKPSGLHGRYTMAANAAVTSVSTAKPTAVLGSTALRQVSLLNKVQGESKKQYYLVTVNGQRILVPMDNNVSAYLFNAKTEAKMTSTTSTVPVPTSASATEPPADNIPPDTAKDPVPVPAKVQKDSSASDASKTTYTLPAGVKIKSEPKTRGYGDEENGTNTTSRKKPKVKVKKELINSEWEEIWSSGTRPLDNPTDVCSSGETSTTKPNLRDTFSSTLTTSSDVVGTGSVDADDIMPELPLMQLPSTEEIVKKGVAQETRIEKLKAMLKEKEMLIEQLKRERVEESIYTDDDAFS